MQVIGVDGQAAPGVDGNVVMFGVSLRGFSLIPLHSCNPPHLKTIFSRPWGLTDFYRDIAYRADTRSAGKWPFGGATLSLCLW